MDQDKLAEAAEKFEQFFVGPSSMAAVFPGLHIAMVPLIEQAKQRTITEAMDQMDVPGAYNFVEGEFDPYPEFLEAWLEFEIALRGGYDEEDEELLDLIDSL